jgi:tryptophanyl-tRNA synthetase
MARIFSGIQPSGELHIGNYLGAVRDWVELQRDHETYICIVDLHAITQEYDVGTLARQSFEMATSLLASGIDPNESVLFVQSHVPEHAELAWVFNTVTPLGELERMTQFKDKSQRQESVLAGLLNYPVLQAADVLLYKADLVPVGEDQLQHIELMREIARKWNARYHRGFFPEPKAQTGDALRITGLDGQSKMSKSLGNTVSILEEPEEIWKSVRPAKTDPARVTRRDPGDPDKCNLYSLHRHFTPPDTVKDVAEKCRSAGWGCLDCKRVLVDYMAEKFGPMRDRARELREHPERVEEILRDGADRAGEVAQRTMRGVREHMGFLPSRVAARVSQ